MTLDSGLTTMTSLLEESLLLTKVYLVVRQITTSYFLHVEINFNKNTENNANPDDITNDDVSNIL